MGAGISLSTWLGASGIGERNARPCPLMCRGKCGRIHPLKLRRCDPNPSRGLGNRRGKLLGIGGSSSVCAASADVKVPHPADAVNPALAISGNNPGDGGANDA